MEPDERPSKIRKLSHNSQKPFEALPREPANPSPDTIELDSVAPAQSHETEQRNSPQNIIRPPSVNDGDGGLSSVRKLEAPAMVSAPGQPLSKNQLKKLRKKQEWEAGRADRKLKRRLKDKQRRQRQREHRDQEVQQSTENGEPVPPLQTNKPKHIRPVRLPITFVIDCGFDDKMTDKERISLGSQVTRAYSDNSKAPYQAHLVVSSWGGLLKERFDTVMGGQYQNWKGKGIEFTEDDFAVAAEQAKQTMSGAKGGTLDGVFRKHAGHIANNDAKQQRTEANGDDDGDAKPTDTTDTPTPVVEDENTDSGAWHKPTTPTPQETAPTDALHAPETIYLTSDSPHTLTELRPNSTYIVGGLVDKNRHKGLCYRVARDRGMKTAKLPIGELMEMQSRFVLATNHVVEIMIRWLECGDWGEAFMRVIPKRKGGRLRESGREEEEEGQRENENKDRIEDDADEVSGRGSDEAGDRVDDNGEEDGSEMSAGDDSDIHIIS